MTDRMKRARDAAFQALNRARAHRTPKPAAMTEALEVFDDLYGYDADEDEIKSLKQDLSAAYDTVPQPRAAAAPVLRHGGNAGTTPRPAVVPEFLTSPFR